jgi:hypothetical protein
MTRDERGPAYFLHISCGVWAKHIGVMFNHRLMDRSDIFGLLTERGTQMICLGCDDKLMSKEGYGNQDDLK